MSERCRKNAAAALKKEFEAGCEIGERHRSYTSPLVSEAETQIAAPQAPRDPADEAMCARARERYTADRKSRFRRRRKRHAELPNLIIIGGLKCGTTSIHHYLGLHPGDPDVEAEGAQLLRRGAELGPRPRLVREPLRRPLQGARRVLPALHEPAPLRAASPERIHEHCPDARLLYMVRDPIKRILSHWVHATGAGYETRELVPALSEPDSSYMNRSKYWMQLQPYLELLRPRADRGHHPGGAAGRTRGDDAQGLRASPASTRASPPSSSTASGRSRAPSRATNTS